MTADWRRAIEDDDVEVLERLHRGGADLDALDAHGQSGVMLAALRGASKAAAWLVARGARLDHTAKYGLSALMLAVINDRPEIVRILIDAGADRTLRGVGAPGFSGKTALDLATAAGRTDIARMIAQES
jgi:ankyrin repeat protein